MTSLRVATCLQLLEPDVDEAPHAVALAAGGFDAQLLSWDDPTVEWETPIPTLVRSTWNSPLAADASVALIRRAS